MKGSSSKTASGESSRGNPLERLLSLIRPPASAPDVILDVVLEDGLLFFEVANIGSACASRIRIELSPSIVGVTERDVREQALFSNLEFLPPGKRIRTFVDALASYFGREAPLRIRAVVTWMDDAGRGHRRVINHDLSIYEDIVEAWCTRSE
jgi:hypothetical protein